MDITLEQEKNHWVMILQETPLNKNQTWDSAVESVDVELKNRAGVKRMAYNHWHWDGRCEQEAREYITYFLVKYL